MRVFCALVSLSATVVAAEEPTAVGSKKFTESYVLAEIAKQSLGHAGRDSQKSQRRFAANSS
jgi:glycine betaine/choline ABC-type transport system substrate-binding protein